MTCGKRSPAISAGAPATRKSSRRCFLRPTNVKDAVQLYRTTPGCRLLAGGIIGSRDAQKQAAYRRRVTQNVLRELLDARAGL